MLGNSSRDAAARKTKIDPSHHASLRGAMVNQEGIVRDVICIGASAGGIHVLVTLFSQLPSDLNAVIAVVLHRGAVRSELLQVLAKRSTLPVIEPSRDSPLKPGSILLAPPDHHLELAPRRALVRRGPKEHSTRPAIDPLFRSAAQALQSRVVGLLLSGGGDDGVNGMIAIKEYGGICLVQEPADAEMPYMPANAIRYDHVDASLPVKWIAPALDRLVRGKSLQPGDVR